MNRRTGLSLAAMAAMTLAGCGSKSSPTPDAGAPVTVTVHTLSLHGTRTPSAVTFLAAQDGTGAWQPITPSGADYSFPVKDPSGKFGVVMVCPLPSSGTREVTEAFATVAEVTEFSLGCTEDPTSTSATSVITQNRGAATKASVTVGSEMFDVAADNAATPTRTVGAGTYDAYGHTENSSGAYLKGVLNHSLIVNGASTQVAVDFASGFSFNPVTVTLTGLNSGDTSPQASASLVSVNGSMFSLGFATGTSPVFSTNTIPATALDPGDFHLISAQATETDSRGRIAIKVTHSPSNMSIALPSAVTSGAVTPIATTPGVLVNTTWSGGPTGQGFLGQALQSTALYIYSASPGWLGGATQFALPDVSGATGWDASWDLQPGVSLSWLLYAISVTPGWAEFYKLLPHQLGGYTEGTEIAVGGKSGLFTP